MKAPRRQPGWLTVLRSALFLLVLSISVIIYGLLLLLTVPLPVKRRIGLVNAWVAFFGWWLRLSCGLDYQVSGLDALPDGPSIIFARHSSAWETLALQRLFPPYAWIIKRELLWLPFFGWGLAMLHPIAIDRSRGRLAVEQIARQGCERLEEGLWVMCFPEATRVPPGQRRRFGMGGAVLASRSGRPVVPVAHNAGVFWRPRGLSQHPGTIQVVVGPPIETWGKTPEAINAEAKAWIDATTERLEFEAVEGGDVSRQGAKGCKGR
jgi:1-acyl-sn-glycerol-3-phosphate acyltransferase